MHRYLKDYEVTRTLVQKFPLHEIPALAKHALSLVREHVQLIREYEPNLVFYSPDRLNRQQPHQQSAKRSEAHLTLLGIAVARRSSTAATRAGEFFYGLLRGCGGAPSARCVMPAPNAR